MKLLNNLAERFGMNAYALGNFAVAEKWFRRLEKTEDDSIRVLRNLGVILLAKGDLEGAERYLLREEKLYGATCKRHRILADLAYTAGIREKALKRYTAALGDGEAAQLSDSENLFLKTRLDICKDASRFELSRAGAKRFTEGEAERTLGKEEEALAAFLEAAQCDPTNWPALNNAGVIYLARKDGAAALRLFEKALECARIPMIERNIELAKESLGKNMAKSPSSN